MKIEAKEIELIELYKKAGNYTPKIKQRNDDFMAKNKLRVQFSDIASAITSGAALVKTVEANFLLEASGGSDLLKTTIPFFGTLIAEFSTFIAAVSFARRYYQNKSVIENLPQLIADCKQSLENLLSSIQYKIQQGITEQTIGSLLADIEQYSKFLMALFYLNDMKLLLDISYRIMWMNIISGSVVAVATGLFSPFGGAIAAHVSLGIKTIITSTCSLFKKATGTYSISNNTDKRIANDDEMVSYIDRLYAETQKINDADLPKLQAEDSSSSTASSTKKCQQTPASEEMPSRLASISYDQLTEETGDNLSQGIIANSLADEKKPKNTNGSVNDVKSSTRSVIANTPFHRLKAYKTQVAEMKANVAEKRANTSKLGKKIVNGKTLVALGGLIVTTLAIIALFMVPGTQLLGAFFLLAFLMSLYGPLQCVGARLCPRTKIAFEQTATTSGPQLFKHSLDFAVGGEETVTSSHNDVYLLN